MLIEKEKAEKDKILNPLDEDESDQFKEVEP